MAGQQTAADATPPADESKKTPAELASEAEAAKAHKALQLFKVTTDRKLGSPQPFQAFALVPGANHFEGPLPEPVAARFEKLQAAGTITVEVLDGDGKSSAWPPEKKPATES